MNSANRLAALLILLPLLGSCDEEGPIGLRSTGTFGVDDAVFAVRIINTADRPVRYNASVRFFDRAGRVDTPRVSGGTVVGDGGRPIYIAYSDEDAVAAFASVTVVGEGSLRLELLRGTGRGLGFSGTLVDSAAGRGVALTVDSERHEKKSRRTRK